MMMTAAIAVETPSFTWELSQTQKTGPGDKTTVTKRAIYSIRLHPAFINLPLKISSGDKSNHI